MSLPPPPEQKLSGDYSKKQLAVCLFLFLILVAAALFLEARFD